MFPVLLVLIGLLASTGCTTAAARWGRAASDEASLAALVPLQRIEAIPQAQAGKEEVILATTTSTQDSGLLETLVPLFERQTGYRVKTIAVGTGQALALGARGAADVVLVHAPDAEARWMAAGNGAARRRVMHNDFVLVGPPDDPAGARKATSAAGALQKIAAARAVFVSRGDESGTHEQERSLWRAAGVDPKSQPWYLETGQGMGISLHVAGEKRGYTLSDRATFLAHRNTLQLESVYEADEALMNVYHVMPVNHRKFQTVNAAGGHAFAAFLISREAQDAITHFGVERFGQPLFFTDAGTAAGIAD
ncbi:MAG: substrate-binding domain-containing protein [Chloroflexi bacterium]|nr:substrate-binding domain-containing protein [Chloroflexota bacterium]